MAHLKCRSLFGLPILDEDVRWLQVGVHDGRSPERPG